MNLSQQDLISALDALEEFIMNCEGAIMAAKSGDYLHNFAFMLQQKIADLKSQLNDCTNAIKTFA